MKNYYTCSIYYIDKEGEALNIKFPNVLESNTTDLLNFYIKNYNVIFFKCKKEKNK